METRCRSSVMRSERSQGPATRRDREAIPRRIFASRQVRKGIAPLLRRDPHRALPESHTESAARAREQLHSPCEQPRVEEHRLIRDP